jgi:hypothetical protein
MSRESLLILRIDLSPYRYCKADRNVVADVYFQVAASRR